MSNLKFAYKVERDEARKELAVMREDYDDLRQRYYDLELTYIKLDNRLNAKFKEMEALQANRDFWMAVALLEGIGFFLFAIFALWIVSGA